MSDKIIDKIKKLLAMSNGRGTTPEESASFAAEAQRLMTQHGLDSATVMARGLAKGQEHDGPVGVHRASEKTSRRRIIWQGRLAAAIAESGGGDMYWQQYHRYDAHGERVVETETMFIGRPNQVECWRVMYEWLCDEVDRLCKDALATLPAWENSRNYANAFRLGAVDTICQRLRDSAKKQREEFERQANEEAPEVVTDSAGTSALVHVKRNALAIIDEQRAEVVRFKKSNLKIRAGAPSRGGRRSSDGYQDGRAAGETVNLQTKMPVR